MSTEPATGARPGPPPVDDPTACAALADLRRTRRRRRIGDIAWFDAAYRAYLVGIVGIVLTLLVATWVGDAPVSGDGLERLRADAPALIGLAAALAVAVGVRSGSRGGPLAVTAAEVRHVLLSPVDRGRALRPGAWRQLRFAAFAGAVTGAVAGELAARRLPELDQLWVAAGALCGAATLVLAVAVALVAGGLRTPRPVATGLALVALGWGAAGAAADVWSPFATVGGIALWPLRVGVAEVVALAAVVGLAGVGVRGIGRVRIEDVERRTALIGPLRFAVTLQDLRTVLVLRRQLAQDLPRHRPWFRLRRGAGRMPIWRRAWAGLARFPLPRIARMAGLGAIAGAAGAGVWRGTTPLVAVGALALYVAALDATEPVAQELDLPDRTEALPVARGELLLRLLPASVVVMLVVSAIAGVVGAVIVGEPAGWIVAAMSVPLTAVAASVGAVLSTLSSAPGPSEVATMLPPEVSGMWETTRSVLPLVVAHIGWAPVLVAVVTARGDGDVLGAAGGAAGLAAALLVPAIGWVRLRDEIRQWFRAAQEDAGAARTGRGPRPGEAAA